MRSSEDVIAIVNASPLICINCGSLGVLAKAQKSGMISNLNTCVVALRESGLYLSQDVVDRLKSHV
jgi:predicted nucleic acid-binding protein